MSLIFIIDDQQINRRILEQLAKGIEPNVNVMTFCNPGEVFQSMGNARPDLVITDYNMPVMNGVEFIRKFREIPLNLQVFCRR